MASKTTNYGLNKHSPQDFYNVEARNENWDKIDEALAATDPTKITAKATGPVERVSLLDYGDVKAGQLLVQLGAKDTDEEKAARSAALQEATLYATQVPLRTMKTAFGVFEIVRAMAAVGNPNSVSDAGVGALAARELSRYAVKTVLLEKAGERTFQ